MSTRLCKGLSQARVDRGLHRRARRAVAALACTLSPALAHAEAPAAGTAQPPAVDLLLVARAPLQPAGMIRLRGLLGERSWLYLGTGWASAAASLHQDTAAREPHLLLGLEFRTASETRDQDWGRNPLVGMRLFASSRLSLRLRKGGLALVYRAQF